MPSLKTYDLFISHAWTYSEDYLKLENLLKAAPLFAWRNYSVPMHDPLVDPNTLVGKQKLTSMLDNQIRPVNCVLIISGMYAIYREWIQKEIVLAQNYNKPIIGVIPRGQERTPVDVQNAAKTMVGWNTDSIVSVIRTYSI